jgi:hypothetical protein
LKPDDVNWISINGAAPSLQELMAGGVDLVACSLPEARTLMNAGQVRCLGVMSPERLEQFPDVPTFRDQGVDWVMEGWRGIAVPAGTPDDIADKAAAALTVAVNSEPFREFMSGRGFNWSFEGPVEFGASMALMDRQFGEVLTSEAFRSTGKRVIGPMFFPGLLAAIGLVVLVILLARGGFKSDETIEGLSRYGLMRSAEVIGWVIVYLLAAEWAGFILTAGALLILLLIRFGVRLRAAALVTLFLVPALYQIFAVLLRVPLPRGWLGW